MEMIRCTRCMAELGAGDQVCPHCGYRQDRSDQPGNALKKETILRGRYLVGNVIGQGGFGITYVGYDLTLEMKIAIKEYFPSGNAMRTGSQSGVIQWTFVNNDEKQWSDGMDRFLTEARRMAKLDSVPSIVRVRDAFRENQTAYIVMDFVEGETLKSSLLSRGIMDYNQCMSLLAPVLDSLAVIHDNGFIHRDISPDNIMIRPDGSARLLDMGAAVDIRANDGHASMAVVKRNFSAPEQYMDEALGSWTDVYAMAATIYYCLTGKVVPEAMEREFKQIPITFPPELNIPPHAAQALTQALELKAENRIRNMRELKARLMEPGSTAAAEADEERTAAVRQDETKEAGSRTGKRIWNKKTLMTGAGFAVYALILAKGHWLAGVSAVILGLLLVWRGHLKAQGKKIPLALKIGVAVSGIIPAFATIIFLGALIFYTGREEEAEETRAAETTQAATAETSAENAREAAAETEDGGKWYDEYDERGFYSFNDDGTYTLKLWIDDSDTCLKVPGEFHRKPVTAIGDNAFVDLSFEQIRFPDTVKVIGEGVLDRCEDLRAVFLPSSVEEIRGPLISEYEEDHEKVVFFVGRYQEEVEKLNWCDNWQGIENKMDCYFPVTDQAETSGWRHDYGEEWIYYEDGFVKFDWQTIDGKEYWFNDEAVACTGWADSTDGSNTWYFDPKDCFMVTGWKEIDGKWYYFDTDDGHLLRDTRTPDGYQVDADGVYEK